MNPNTQKTEQGQKPGFFMTDVFKALNDADTAFATLFIGADHGITPQAFKACQEAAELICILLPKVREAIKIPPVVFDGFHVFTPDSAEMTKLTGLTSEDIVNAGAADDPVVCVLVAKVSKFYICLHQSGKFSTIAMQTSAYGTLEECIKCIETEMGETVIRPALPTITLWKPPHYEGVKYSTEEKHDRVKEVFNLSISYDDGQLNWLLQSQTTDEFWEGGFEYPDDGRGGKNLEAVYDTESFDDIDGNEELLTNIANLTYEWLHNNREIGVSLNVFEPEGNVL